MWGWQLWDDTYFNFFHWSNLLKSSLYVFCINVIHLKNIVYFKKVNPILKFLSSLLWSHYLFVRQTFFLLLYGASPSGHNILGLCPTAVRAQQYNGSQSSGNRAIGTLGRCQETLAWDANSFPQLQMVLRNASLFIEVRGRLKMGFHDAVGLQIRMG